MTNSQNNKEGSAVIKAAVIGGIIAGVFAVLVACIGGVFLIANTLIDKDKIVVIPTLQSQVEPTLFVAPPTLISIQPTLQNTPIPPSSQPNDPVATPIPEIPTQPPVYIPPVDPYPQLSLPFFDNFDNGFSSEWRIVNGQPIVSNGYLGAATDDVILEIGNNSLSNYTVSFDYKDTYNGTWLGGVSLIIAQKVKFETQGCPHWQALVDNKWTQISECERQIEIPGKLRLTVNGNTYNVYINGTPVSGITYGETLSGSFSIYVEQRTLVDNLTITSP